MRIHHQAFSHTWALEVNDQVGEGVQFRRIGTLVGRALFVVPMTNGWYSLPKVFEYLTKSEKSHGSARAYSL
jgi:hypothetical protein